MSQMMSVFFRSYPDSTPNNSQQDIKTTVYRSSIFAFHAYHITRVTSKDVAIFKFVFWALDRRIVQNPYKAARWRTGLL